MSAEEDELPKPKGGKVMRNLLRMAPAAVVVGALGFVSLAQAADYDVNNKVTLSSNKAGGTAKIKLDFSHGWTVADPGFPPPGVSRLYISLPKGAKINTKITEECDTGTLEETYGEGCPSDSKLGSGTGVVDARECNMGSLDAKVSVYESTTTGSNVMNIAIVANEPQSGANVIYKAPIVKQGGLYVIKIDDFAIPPILSCRLVLTHGIFNIDATKRVKVSVKRNGKKKKIKIKQGLIQLPKKCSGDKTWKFKSDETFLDGGLVIVKDIPVNCK